MFIILLIMERGHKYPELAVEPGYKAPDFTLKDENGEVVSLYGFLGDHSTVLVFLRGEDDIPTGELLDYLTDSYQRIQYHCADVLAVSYGSVELNRHLVEKHMLPFHILSDADCAVIKKYDIFNDYDKLVGPSVYIMNCAGLITYMYNAKNSRDIPSDADIISVLHDMMDSSGAKVYGGAPPGRTA